MRDARCEDLHQPDALGEKESFFAIGYINIFFRPLPSGGSVFLSLFFDGRHPSRRIGRIGSLVTIIAAKSVKHAEIRSPGSTDTPRREGTARRGCVVRGRQRRGDPAVSFLDLARTTSSALPVVRERQAGSRPGAPGALPGQIDICAGQVCPSAPAGGPVHDAGDDVVPLVAVDARTSRAYCAACAARIGLGDEVGNVDRSLFRPA